MTEHADTVAVWKALADELAAVIRQEFDGFPEEMFLTTAEVLERYDRLREGSLLAATGRTDTTVCWRCGGLGVLKGKGANHA